jgi:His/Glu/Gln/Arg/opine family amino acid ABC transporter permease subunit
MLLSSAYSFDWSVVPKSIGILAEGLGYTLEISALSLLLAVVLGLPVALARMSRFRPLSLLAYAYIQVFRALTIYVYILFVYFGLAAFLGLNLSPLEAAVVSLTLLNSAYMAEIYRSAIAAIDAGQREAALSLGIGPVMTFGTVILPQAWRVAFPSLVNQFVDIIKDSSIVAVIGAGDLMYRTIVLVSFYQRPFEFYTTTGAIYVAVVVTVSRLAARLERRLRVSVA